MQQTWTSSIQLRITIRLFSDEFPTPFFLLNVRLCQALCFQVKKKCFSLLIHLSIEAWKMQNKVQFACYVSTTLSLVAQHSTDRLAKCGIFQIHSCPHPFFMSYKQHKRIFLGNQILLIKSYFYCLGNNTTAFSHYTQKHKGEL